MRQYVSDLLRDSECILNTGHSLVFVLSWERQEYRDLYCFYEEFDSDWSVNEERYGNLDSSAYLAPSEEQEVWSVIKSENYPIFYGEVTINGIELIKITEAEVIDAINEFNSRKPCKSESTDALNKIIDSEPEIVSIIVQDFFQGHMPYAYFRLIDKCKNELAFTDDDLYGFFVLAAKRGYLFKIKSLYALSIKYHNILEYARDPLIRSNEDNIKANDHSKDEIEEIYGISFLNEKSYRDFLALRLMKVDDTVRVLAQETDERLMKSAFETFGLLDYCSQVYFDLSYRIKDRDRCEDVAKSLCHNYGITRTETMGNLIRYLNFRRYGEGEKIIRDSSQFSGFGPTRRSLLRKAFDHYGIVVPYINELVIDN